MLVWFMGAGCGLSWWMRHVSFGRMCILLLLDEVVDTYQLYPADWWCFAVQFCPYWFSAYWMRPFLMEGCWVVICNSGVIYSSLQCYQFLPHVFWCPVVRYVRIKDYYVFLENGLLYHNVMPLFIPDNFSCSKITSGWNQYKCSSLLLISVSMKYLPLTFKFIHSFIFKVGFLKVACSWVSFFALLSQSAF